MNAIYHNEIVFYVSEYFYKYIARIIDNIGYLSVIIADFNALIADLNAVGGYLSVTIADLNAVGGYLSVTIADFNAVGEYLSVTIADLNVLVGKLRVLVGKLCVLVGKLIVLVAYFCILYSPLNAYQPNKIIPTIIGKNIRVIITQKSIVSWYLAGCTLFISCKACLPTAHITAHAKSIQKIPKYFLIDFIK